MGSCAGDKLPLGNKMNMPFRKEYTDREHLVSAFTDIQEFRDTDEFCDISVKVENKEIKAHRVILAASSQYFKNMLNAPSSTAASKIFDLSQQSFQPTKDLIDYIYTGKIEVCLDTVEQLYKTAEFLQIDRVKTICSHFLKTSLNKENCLMVWHVAGNLELEDLQNDAKKQSIMTIDLLLSSGTFLNLSHNKVEDLLRESSDHTNVEKIYRAILAWVKHDTEKRKKLLGKLLQFVVPQKISSQFLRSTIIKEPLLTEDLNCMVWMHQIFVALFDTEAEDIAEQDDESLWDHQKGHIYVCSVRGKYSTFYKYDTVMSEIEDLPARSRSRYSYPVLYNGSIYFTGGLENTGCSTQCDRYNINNDSWDAISLDCDRYYHGACVVKDQLYVVGGCKDHQNLNTVKTYDFETGRWMNASDMSVARKFFGIAKQNECIYAIGGVTDKPSQSSTVERYDPREGVWHNLTRLNRISSACSAAAPPNALYCSAFRSGVTERLELRTNQWVEVPSAPNFPGCLVSTKGELYRASVEGVHHFDSYKQDWDTVLSVNSFSTEIVAVCD